MIYCVEDDDNIRELVVYTLDSTGLPAKGFPSGTEFKAALKNETPELILLDIMLPGEDGMELLSDIRKNSKTKNVPVIMLTAKGAEYDKVSALDMGADDYVTKPFSGQVLVSRINALLRRSGGFANDMPDGLTASEQRLYSYFTLNKGRVLTRDQLLAHMWDSKGEYVSDNTLSVAVNRIRSKLAGHGRIVTVKGVGYKWEDL